MASLCRFFTRGLVPVIFLVFFAIGSASAKKAGDADDTAPWLTYSNPKSNFTFMYPRGWEITDDFFYKTHWSVNIQQIGGDKDSDNWIRINSPQFQEEDGVCVKVGEETICTYARAPDVLEIFKKVAAGFKLKGIQQDKKPGNNE